MNIRVILGFLAISHFFQGGVIVQQTCLTGAKVQSHLGFSLAV